MAVAASPRPTIHKQEIARYIVASPSIMFSGEKGPLMGDARVERDKGRRRRGGVRSKPRVSFIVVAYSRIPPLTSR